MLKNNTAIYLENNSKNIKINKKSTIKSRLSLITVLMLSFLTIAGLFSNNFSKVSADNTQTPDEWIMCTYFKDNDVSKALLTIKDTYDIQFFIDSKSAITPGYEKVTDGLNAILAWSSGNDYNKINEDILGHPLDPTDTKTDKAKFNGGNKVNPYDRFGVSGLTFTSYRGEWKYVIVDPCSKGAEPNDPKLSVFYDGRLAPKTIWDGISTSQDVRTKQFNNPLVTHLWFGYVNTFANWTFDITKFIVVLAITLINLSFSNIVSLLGIDKILAGSSPGDTKSLFNTLYNNLYVPLLGIIFTITGLYIFYKGIIKRQYRESLNILLRSIAMLFVGVIILVNPIMFVNLPNNFTVLIQSVLASSMNSQLSGGDGMCATDIGIKSQNIFSEAFSNDTKKNEDILAQASQNMKSSIGCSLWQQFLLKPYVQGQFGTDWNKLWVNNKTASWAPQNSATLGNTDNNAKMVGDATVPLGGGSTINNWAIFQISTNTNAHSPVNKDGDYSGYTNGVANDWWRITDALSNYEETTAKAGEQSYAVPANNNVIPEWDDWVGNNQLNRYINSNASLIVALVGLSAPTYLSGLCAIYGIEMALIIAFAPIMLLMGCWPGQGFQIFSDWAKLLLRLIVKKILVGMLAILSITFVSTFIKIMENDNWWTGMLLMVIFSILIIKNKDKIIDSVLSASSLFQHNMQSANVISGKINGTLNKGKNVAKSGAKLGGAAIVGGTTSRINGGTFKGGVKAGTHRQLQMLGSRSNFVRQGLYERDIMKNTINRQRKAAGLPTSGGSNIIDPEKTRCMGCGNPIKDTAMDSNGMAYYDGMNWWCQVCGLAQQNESGIELDYVNVDTADELEEFKQKNKPKPVYGNFNNNNDVATIKLEAEEIRDIRSKPSNQLTTEEKDLITSPDKQMARENLLRKTIISTTAKLAANAEIAKATKTRIQLADIPNELKPYLGDFDLINRNINQNTPEFNQWVETMMVYAWINWYEDTTKEKIKGRNGFDEGSLISSIQAEKQIIFDQVQKAKASQEKQEQENTTYAAQEFIIDEKYNLKYDE